MTNAMQKSRNHITFIGKYEYFTLDNGNLYRAAISYPVQKQHGQREGRLQAPKRFVDDFMKQVYQFS